MNKKKIIFILFLLFVFEGTVFPFMAPDYYGSSISIVPRFVLIIIMVVSIFKDRKFAMFLGIGFGLLYDIIYGNALGLYMVGMGGIGYFSGWLIQYFHPTLSVFLVIEFLGLALFELFIYGMLRLYQLLNIPFDWIVFNVYIPSIIFNLFFALFIYFPLQFYIDNKE